MSEELGAALDIAAQPQDARNVYDVIVGMETQLQRSLQSEQAAQILTRHYFNAIRFAPLLRQCTEESLVAALLLTAQCRLEPGPLGHVYLVPKKIKTVWNVQWWLGYTGIIELGRRGGAIGLRASVVWDNDVYEEPWESEKGIKWTRKPGDPSERQERVGVLVSWREGTERMAVHCPPSRIDAALSASAMKDTDRREQDWYWRKTGVRFARPWLPLSTELAQAASADDSLVRGLEQENEAAFPVLESPDVGDENG